MNESTQNSMRVAGTVIQHCNIPQDTRLQHMLLDLPLKVAQASMLTLQRLPGA